MDLKPASPLDVLSGSEGYRRHFMDEALWGPFVHEVAGMHRLGCNTVRAGRAGTFPCDATIFRVTRAAPGYTSGCRCAR